MPDHAQPSTAFISVGSNIEPERNIRAALDLLRSRAEVVRSSTFYRTEPLGRPDQPKFVNGVWQIRTSLEPLRVPEELLRPIEQALGRRRTEDKFAPRTLDLDLVLYDAVVYDKGGMRLPHPDLGRPFVYVPVCELLEGGDPELAERIRALLPKDAGALCPGEALAELTEQLRHMLA